MDCLETNTVVALVDGRLGPEGRALAERHLDECPSCAQLVAGAAAVGSPDPHIAEAQAALSRAASVGRYMILESVGRGGMGEVYAAYDPQLDRKVALKLLHGHLVSGDSAARARARLLREARAIARLSHPNVVVVHDAGEIDGRVFLAMDFVEGETLAAWLKAAPRGWREVRDVFMAAGRGLAAAHDAGVVHRDFKPQNVMMGRDGLVRVMDFGLASDPAAADDPPRRPGVAPLGLEGQPEASALTCSGLLMGTPLYMAPEQFSLRGVDARSDQYSFCVALYEALYGERPFPTDSLARLVEAKVAGQVRETANDRRVPAFLRQLLLRGLAPDADRRFPSMSALLTSLQKDPIRRRRKWAAAATALGILVAVAAAWRRSPTRGQRFCQSGSATIAEAWDLEQGSARRTAIERAFLKNGSALAEQTWARVATRLDDYARAWRTMYVEACEATHVRGEQSFELLNLRMACMEKALASLRELSGAFAHADETMVFQAVNATVDLPQLDRCANVPALEAVLPLPADSATRLRADGVRTELVKIKVQEDTGHWLEARRSIATVVEQARAIGYMPLLAEALAMNSWLALWFDDYSVAAGYEETLWVAMSARRDDLAVESASLLMWIMGVKRGHFAEAERWRRFAEALLPRIGPGGEKAEAWHYNNRGVLREEQGDYKGALDDEELGLKLKQAIYGPEHPDVALSWVEIGNIRIRLHDYEGGFAAMDRAFAIAQRTYGPDSPILGFHYDARGDVLSRLGRYEEAEHDLREAIGRMNVVPGPDHVWLADPYTALGNTLTATNRVAEGLPFLEEALRLRERDEPERRQLDETRFSLARALWEAGRDHARARALATAAHARYLTSPAFATEAAEVDRWLKDHPLPSTLARRQSPRVLRRP